MAKEQAQGLSMLDFLAKEAADNIIARFDDPEEEKVVSYEEIAERVDAEEVMSEMWEMVQKILESKGYEITS